MLKTSLRSSRTLRNPLANNNNSSSSGHSPANRRASRFSAFIDQSREFFASTAEGKDSDDDEESISLNNNDSPDPKQQQQQQEEESDYHSMSSSSDGDFFADNNEERHLSRSRRASRHHSQIGASIMQQHHKQNKAVQWSKCLILIVLVIIATFIIVFTSFYLKQEEQDAFDEGFENLALEMLHRVTVMASHMESSFHSLAGGVTAYSQQYSPTWPLVTLPNWQARAWNTWPLTHAAVIGMSPFVVASTNLSQWETYSQSTASQAWIHDALPFQQQLWHQLSMLSNHNNHPNNDNNNNNPTTQPFVWQEDITDQQVGITDYVYHLDANGQKVPAASTRANSTFLPVWQLAPAPRHNASIVNFDLLNQTVVASAVAQLVATHQRVLTPAFADIAALWQGALPTSASMLVTATATGDDQTPVTTTMAKQQQQQSPPASLWLEPVWSYIEKEMPLDTDQERMERIPPSLVGVVHAVMPWHVFLAGAVTNPDIRGLCVVMEWIPTTTNGDASPCPPGVSDVDEKDIHPVFTYRIDGRQATFVGYGDLHEDKYSDMVQSRDFQVPTHHYRRGSRPTTTSNGVTPHDVNGCVYGHYRLNVYPSQELKDINYSPNNSRAWFYAAGVVCIFCVATIIFLSYDKLVQLRQKAVLDTAIRSNAIVTNLFPSNVRDRIMKEAEEQAEAEYQQKKQQRKLRRKARRRKERRKNESGLKKQASTASLDPNNAYMTVPKKQLQVFLNEDGDKETNGHRDSHSSQNSESGPLDGPANTDNEAPPHQGYGGKPIADLFPSATVLFGDIVGFTAWSSVREPTQVFQLLETLYHHFDELANKRKVFKVETIGDCYVAVTGLPDPRPDHAIVMARFAKDILTKMKDLCGRLEVILGPDTGDLCLRIGLHSGAVTAGVLRGEKSRFQLFGDTVNTAARMESTGAANKIHMSADTAKLLQAHGKKWAKRREDAVEAKGKGRMETYWLATGRAVDQQLGGVANATSDHFGSNEFALNPKPRNMSMDATRRMSGMMSSMISGAGASIRNLSLTHMSANNHESRRNLLNASSAHGDAASPSVHQREYVHSKKKVLVSKKTSRLVRWNTEVLARLLKQVVARRLAVHRRQSLTTGSSREPMEESPKEPRTFSSTVDTEHSIAISALADSFSNFEDSEGEFGTDVQTTVLEEVQEIIELPVYDAAAARNQEDPASVNLSSKVREQLLDYVTEVASMYRYNPFHNFEHASHVTMSVVKLLSRIVAPDAVLEGNDGAIDQLDMKLHDHTYGITSDPLTQFAVVFSGLIHDMDHPGVPNATLVKEETSLASLYKNKSVAEQNSVDLAWELLMSDAYKELRATIYRTKAEKKRFRQLVVNAVMATDIVDQELKKLRNNRWEKAFQEKELESEQDRRDDVNRKATIVIEHLIQASDVAHTMQHWHIYRKWNERFFEEMYAAFKEGRAEKDPTDFWYQGEIGFFDFYIIPLAKKLKDCGVFGVSSEEYLNYALTNRKEWEAKGQDVVKSYIEKYGTKAYNFDEGNAPAVDISGAASTDNVLGDVSMRDDDDHSADHAGGGVR